jgi:hypothetical protein
VTEVEGWRAADPSRYPQQVCRGLAQLLSQANVHSVLDGWRDRLEAYVPRFPQGGEQCGGREGAVSFRAPSLTSFN